jgi:hypothetical protein
MMPFGFSLVVWVSLLTNQEPCSLTLTQDRIGDEIMYKFDC